MCPMTSMPTSCAGEPRPTGWPDAVCTVVHDDRPARGIVEHVAGRPGTVLVMATTAKSSLRKRLLGSVSEEVLRTVDRPVLLVGPAVTDAEVADVRAGTPVTDDTDANGETFDRNPAAVEILDADECWALLRSIRVGRLAMCADGRPLIFPVNYVVDGRSIVFRTAPGTKLAAAPRSRRRLRDRRLRRSHPGGVERDRQRPRDRDHRARRGRIVGDSLGLPLFPWDVVPKSHFLRIAADEASGRRFQPSSPVPATSSTVTFVARPS